MHDNAADSAAPTKHAALHVPGADAWAAADTRAAAAGAAAVATSELIFGCDCCCCSVSCASAIDRAGKALLHVASCSTACHYTSLSARLTRVVDLDRMLAHSALKYERSSLRTVACMQKGRDTTLETAINPHVQNLHMCSPSDVMSFDC